MPETASAFDESRQYRNWYAAFDPLLTAAEAADLVELCHRHGSYKMYSEEPTFEGLGQGYPARYDAARNFVLTGGRFGRSEPIHVLAARTNYFRETYAYGEEIVAPGIEPYLLVAIKFFFPGIPIFNLMGKHYPGSLQIGTGIYHLNIYITKYRCTYYTCSFHLRF